MQRPAIRDVLAELGARGVTHLMVEAGARVNGAFLREDLVDEVVIFHAPVEFGGDAVPFAEGGATADEVEKKIINATEEYFGEDRCVRGLLRDPWAVVG
jgi:diaminohydroxyphosphoribosylaminopyrimidine deaminase/5-amino-6-(5-phosphoribosylamino)uracil reductase